MDDKLTVNLIDEKVTASGLNDDSVVVDKEDETLNVSFQDEKLGATLGDSELDVQLAVGTFREHDYNKLINKPQINGETLQGDKSAQELGLVPINLSSFRAVEQPTKSFRQSSDIFVNNGANGFRMTLQQVKDMSTKIVAVKNVSEVDFSKLDKDDYVYIEN